jgi:hypothetical protein
MTRTIYCSFCGRSNLDTGNMMETTDQHVKTELCRICLECAQMAVAMLEQHKGTAGESAGPQAS